MNGFEALAHMRRDHARTPVIVLTAVADVPTVCGVDEAGRLGLCREAVGRTTCLSLSCIARHAMAATNQGLLLVSDNIASLAPLQLALESQTRVLATNIRTGAAVRVSPHGDRARLSVDPDD